MSRGLHCSIFFECFAINTDKNARRLILVYVVRAVDVRRIQRNLVD